MYNHPNPFSHKKYKPATSYNSIKRNRAFRSEKKLTQIQHTTHSKQSLKTELIALLDATPHSQDLIKNCLDELKEKLLDMRISQRKKQPLPLQHESIFKRKQPETDEHRKRAKTKPENQPMWKPSQSLNLVPQRKSQEFRQLLNLEEMRRKIKESKQNIAEKRIPTEKQHFRYEQFQDMREAVLRKETSRRGQRNYSDVKFRSMTEQVIRSHKNPARIYQSLKKVTSSPKKMQMGENQNTEAVLSPKKIVQNTPDNNEISKQLFAQKIANPTTKILDNNEKIGDISTIQAQKETLNFLGESCVGIKQQLSPQKSRRTSGNPAKMLQFVDWKTNELKNVFSSMAQHKKRKQGLEKLSKIFPKGFFS